MQREQLLRDNPNLMQVEGDENEAVLMWAASEGYIRLKEFGTKHWYSQENLDDAVMWAEKREWNGDGMLGR